MGCILIGIYDADAEMDRKYISFASHTELQRNSIRRDGSAGKQFIGKYLKGKMQNRQPFSILGFAIEHGNAQKNLNEREALVQCGNDAPAKRGVASVERHETEFEPTQPRYILADTVLLASAEAQGAFLGTMYEECHQQPQAGFYLVRDMLYQSKHDDVVIVVTKMCLGPRPKLAEDPWDAAGELFCSVFGAMNSDARPLIVRTVAKREGGNQPWAPQPPENKEYWPPRISQKERCNVL